MAPTVVFIHEVEKKIHEHYKRIELHPDLRALTETVVRDELKTAREAALALSRDSKLERDKLERQRSKLMEAHYAGAVPLDLLASEQERITKAIAQIDHHNKTTSVHFDEVENRFEHALDLLEKCADMYRAAPDHIKKQLNQALFSKFLIISDSNQPDSLTITSTLNAPFHDLVTLTQAIKAELHNSAQPQSKKVETLRSLLGRNSLSNSLLVELRGFEPLTFSLRTRRATNCAIAPVPLAERLQAYHQRKRASKQHAASEHQRTARP